MSSSFHKVRAARYLGTPCKRGHSGERFSSNRACVECSTQRSVAWNAAHPEAAARSRAKWARANRDRANALNRAHYSRYADRIKQAKRDSHKQNPLLNRLREARKRARALGAPGPGISVAEWDALVAATNGCCAYCGRRRTLTMDHLVPLTRGGHHVFENIVPACQSCNSSKGKKLPAEWTMSPMRGLAL